MVQITIGHDQHGWLAGYTQEHNSKKCPADCYALTHNKQQRATQARIHSCPCA